jgi:hypothetical protein
VVVHENQGPLRLDVPRLPVGTLMFWETGAEVGTRQVGGGERDRVAKLLIVDGQQRLTSLSSRS